MTALEIAKESIKEKPVGPTDEAIFTLSQALLDQHENLEVAIKALQYYAVGGEKFYVQHNHEVGTTCSVADNGYAARKALEEIKSSQ